MDLHIKYRHQQEEKVTILQYERKRLESTTYFSGLFGATEQCESIVVDLTFIDNIEPKLIDIIFEIEFGSYLDHLLQSDQTVSRIEIHMDRNGNEEKKYELIQNMGLKDVDMVDLYNIACICDYFDFPKTRNVIKKCLTNYCSMFDYCVFYNVSNLFRPNNDSSQSKVDISVDCYKYPNYFLNKLVPRNIVEICIINVKPKGLYNNIVPNDSIFLKSLHKAQLPIFYRCAYYIFLTCRLVGMMGKFCEIIKEIKMILWRDHENMFNIGMNTYVCTTKEMDNRYFKDIVEFIDRCDGIIAFDNQEVVNIYEYYDKLIEEGEYKCTKCVPINNLSIEKHNIALHKVVSDNFRVVAQGIFDGFDWSGVYMCGPFVYKLLHNIPVGLSEMQLVCSNIDGLNYVYSYFEKFNPYYVGRSVNRRILIKELSFDISVCLEEKCESGLFSWEQLRYNGVSFQASFNGLILLKYKMCKMIVHNLDQLYDILELGISVVANLPDAISRDSTIYDKSGCICFDKLKGKIDWNRRKRAETVRELWNNNIKSDIIGYFIRTLY